MNCRYDEFTRKAEKSTFQIVSKHEIIDAEWIEWGQFSSNENPSFFLILKMSPQSTFILLYPTDKRNS